MRLKFLILAISVLSVLESVGQSNYIPYASRNRYIALKADSTFHIPSGTTPSLRTGGYDYRGALFYRTSDSSVYVYTGSQWILMSGSGATDSTVFATLYRVDSAKVNLRTSIYSKIDSLRRTGVNIQAYKNGTWITQYTDSVGSGGGSQTLQQTTDLGDSTTGRLVTSDTIRNYWGVNRLNTTIGDSVPSGKTAIFFGHSVVANVGVLNYLYGYPYKVAKQFGWLYYNRGIAGTTVRHWASGDSCLLDRLSIIPNYSAGTHSYLFFNYDINDANSSHGFDTTNYKVDYAKAIDTVLTSRGWPTSRVVILSSNYLDTSVTNAYDNIRLYVRAARSVAEAKGIKWVDMFTPMEADGGSYYLADEDHPNALGTTKIVEMIAKQMPELKAVGEFVVKGGTHIQDSARISGYLRLGDDTTGLSGGTTFKLMNTGTSYFASKAYFATKSDLGSNAWINLLAQSSNPGITVKDATNAYVNIHADQIRVVNSSGVGTQYIGDGLTMSSGNFYFRGSGGTAHGVFGLYGGAEIGSGAGGTALDSALRIAQGLHVVRGVRFSGIPSSTDTSTYKPIGINSSGTVVKLSSWPVGSGGGTTYKIGTYNSQAPSVKGATIVSDSIYMQAFSAENPGLVPSGGTGSTYLKGDGTWGTISGGTGYVDSVSNNAGGDSLIVVKGSTRYAYKYPAGGSASGSENNIQFKRGGSFSGNDSLKFQGSTVLAYGNGSATKPAFASPDDPNTGFGNATALDGYAAFVSNGSAVTAFMPTGMRLGSSYQLYFNANSTSYGGGDEAGIAYSTTDELKITDGSTGNGNIKVGGIRTNFVAKTTTYTIVSTDYTVTGDATSGAFTITLPTAASVAGKIYVIKKTDSSGNAVTVGTTSSQTIDGSTTYSLATQNKYVTVQSNGSNWIVIGNN